MLLTHALKTILFVLHHQCFGLGSGRPAGWRHVDNIVCFCVASVLDWAVVCLGAMRILLFALHRECLDRKVFGLMGIWGKYCLFCIASVLDRAVVHEDNTVYLGINIRHDLQDFEEKCGFDMSGGGRGCHNIRNFLLFFCSCFRAFWTVWRGFIFFIILADWGTPRPPPTSVENSN